MKKWMLINMPIEFALSHLSPGGGEKLMNVEINNGPRRLPIVTLPNGKRYFRDVRLRQWRNVDNPHDFIDFPDD